MSRINLSLFAVAAVLWPLLACGNPVLDQSYEPGITANLHAFIRNDSPPVTSGQFNFAAEAQSFTVGQTGTLAEVDVNLVFDLSISGSNGKLPQQGLTLRVLTTQNASPSNGPGSVLAVAHIPFQAVSQLPQNASDDELGKYASFVPVVFSGQPPVPVTKGQMLAIVLSVDTPELPNTGYTWVGTGPATGTPSPYPGGTAFSKGFIEPQFDSSWLTTGTWLANARADSNESLGFRDFVDVPEPTLISGVAAAFGLLMRRRRHASLAPH